MFTVFRGNLDSTHRPDLPHGLSLLAALGRLPELEAVALRIDGPGEAAVLGLLDAFVDLDAGGAQLLEQGIEIANAIVAIA